MTERWLGQAEAAEILGITKGLLRYRGRRGIITRRQDPDTGRWLYLIPEEGDPVEVSKEIPTQSHSSEEPDPGPAWLESEAFVYARDEQGHARYIFRPTCRGGQPLARSEDWVRRFWRAYTTGATVPEMSLAFGMEQDLVKEIRTALGLRHSSPPWTPEQAAQMSDDELYQDALTMRQARALTKAERAIWRAKEADAQRWRTGPQAMVEAITEQYKPLAPDTWARRRYVDTRRTVVIGSSDIHFGKRRAGSSGPTPEEYGEVVARVMARAVVDALEAWGAPTRWILVCGSDLLHSDTHNQTTTKGTAQGAQSVGSTVAALHAANACMVGLVGECVKSAPVVVPVVPGNHDRLLAFAVGATVAAHYHAHPDVVVHHDDAPHRLYIEHGTPLFFDHGDGVKARDYGALVNYYTPVGVDTSRAVVMRGHYHKAALESTGGLSVVTMPSLSHEDDWHKGKGYLGRSGVGAYLITSEGLKATRWTYKQEDRHGKDSTAGIGNSKGHGAAT